MQNACISASPAQSAAPTARPQQRTSYVAAAMGSAPGAHHRMDKSAGGAAAACSMLSGSGGGTPQPTGVPHIIPLGSAGQCSGLGSRSAVAPSRMQASGAAAKPGVGCSMGGTGSTAPAGRLLAGVSASAPLVASDRSTGAIAAPAAAAVGWVPSPALSPLAWLELGCGAAADSACTDGVAGQLTPGRAALRAWHTSMGASESQPLAAVVSCGQEGGRGSTPPLATRIMARICDGGVHQVGT